MADSPQFRIFPKSNPTLATSAGEWTLRRLTIGCSWRYGVVFPVKFGGAGGALGFPSETTVPGRGAEENTTVQKALTSAPSRYVVQADPALRYCAFRFFI